MNSMRVLALDIGTSSVKAAVLDATTATSAGPIAHIPYTLDHPAPEAAEVPAERLWAAVLAAAREATRTVHDVAGVGMSVQTPALVLLDAADRPLMPIWTHLDRRSRPAARQVWATVGDEFLTTTGNRPLPGGMSVVCFRQMLVDDPYLPRKVRSYLHLNGWLGLRMTGERAFDPANASYTGLFDTVTDQVWSPRWCGYFEVDPSWLPPVVSGDATVGTLRSAVAAEMNVPAGIPVKLGTADTSCAMLAGELGPGELLHMVGTTQVLAGLTDHPRPAPRRLTRCFGVGRAFVHVTHNPVGGVALDWLHKLCFHEQSPQVFFHETVPAALERSTRVTFDPPFLGGDRLEIEAHRAAFRDLTLTTDRLDLLTALLTAMQRRHRQALAELGLGERFRRIVLSGGAAEVIHRLIPEYAGTTVHMLDEGSLRGVGRLWKD
jgi:xylulokinase